MGNGSIFCVDVDDQAIILHPHRFVRVKSFSRMPFALANVTINVESTTKPCMLVVEWVSMVTIILTVCARRTLLTILILSVAVYLDNYGYPPADEGIPEHVDGRTPTVFYCIQEDLNATLVNQTLNDEGMGTCNISGHLVPCPLEIECRLSESDNCCEGTLSARHQSNTVD
jgi:hypothetical protein